MRNGRAICLHETPTTPRKVVAISLRDGELQTVFDPNPESAAFEIGWQPQHKLAVAERTIDWFNFWLNDKEDSASEKTDQYQRWRALRRQQQLSAAK